MTTQHRAGRDLPASGRSGGFTLVEVVTVLIILGLIGAYISTRSASLDGTLAARLSEVRSQLRYVQLTALQGGITYVGMGSDGTNYWAQYSNATYLQLPGESATAVSASGKNMQISSFNVQFDSLGIPYNGTTGAKLTSAVTISIVAGGSSGALTVAPETGFVQ